MNILKEQYNKLNNSNIIFNKYKMQQKFFTINMFRQFVTINIQQKFATINM